MSVIANTFDLESKLNRAICALIVQSGTGRNGNTFAGYVSSEFRTLPNTTVTSGEGNEEDFIGNFKFFGKIVFEDPGTLQPGMANPQQPFLDAQTRTSTIISQLVQSDGSPEMEASRVLITNAGRSLALDPSNGANPTIAALAETNADMTAALIK